ncbi:hypothetical protein EEB14_21790 [Rhodococcus sp. WS4]|nr:hypothetical protein EEB14_21790 [Rhodococcus sp. WS4]
MYGHCFAGIAANEQLDVPAAEDSFRRALRLARGSGGTRSQAARLASALHGGLLYDRNEIAANNSGRADRALLQARLLLAACLSSADRAPEAEDVLAPAAATCARLGLIRLLLDGGPRSSRSSRPFRARWTAVDGVRSGRRSRVPSWRTHSTPRARRSGAVRPSGGGSRP